MPKPIVLVRALSKSFGPVRALVEARLSLRPGEVHAVVGENGAGKTTLLSILAGQLRADGGVIEVDGRPASPKGPREAWGLGLGMVHQHFSLVGPLTVLENLALGWRSRARGWRLPLPEVEAEARALMARIGLQVALDSKVEALGVGDRQRVEILRVLLRKPRVLILDEPTAVLAPDEVEGLLELLRTLASEGRCVVIVAHKLDEVLAVADRVTVLRGGVTVLEAERASVDAASLSEAMLGRTVQRVQRPPAASKGGRVVARLRDVSLDRADGSPLLRDVDLTVGAGTILGVAGIEGNGQRELAGVLAGRLRPTAGLAEVPTDPGFVPQDRRAEGLVLGFDLAENLALSLHRDPEYRRGPFLRWSKIRERARREIDLYDVVAPSTRTRAGQLSGGNQQRWVLARELSGSRELLVVENPTRGLDVAGAAFVHRELLGLCALESAPGIVLISTDLDEVLSLSDRVHVMVRGRLLEVPEERRSREGVGAMMLSAGAGG